ncbi:hypothetical protein MRX96_057225 [Rhipicephalus microplus]
MLGAGERILFKVGEETSHFSRAKLTTPLRKRPRNAKERRRSAKIDSFMLCALRSCAHNIFHRNEIPAVEKITAKLSVGMVIPSLRGCTVHHPLADIGFKHKKRNLNSLLID